MDISPDQVWQTALGQLQMQMTRATFNTWVRHTTALSCEDGMFIIGVHNGYDKDWLENRLQGLIVRTLTDLVGQSVQVRFVVWNPTPSEQAETPLFKMADKQRNNRPRPSRNVKLTTHPPITSTRATHSKPLSSAPAIVWRMQRRWRWPKIPAWPITPCSCTAE